jgi:hypothetical protein
MCIIAVCLLLVLMELLLSEGNTKKYIQGVLKLVIIAALLGPVVALAGGKIDLNELFAESEATAGISDNDFLSGVNDMHVKIAEQKVETALLADGVIGAVEIETENDEIKSVTVTIENSGINSDGGNILSNEKIIETVCDTVEVEKDKVFVYGGN